MAKPVTESVRIVIRTDDGNRILAEGSGSAVHGMHTAFMCLGPARREKLLAMLTKTHADMQTREAAVPTAQPPQEA